MNDPGLRIVGIPGSHEWELRGDWYGQERRLSSGTLYGMLRYRAELELRPSFPAPSTPMDFLPLDENATVEQVQPCA